MIFVTYPHARSDVRNFLTSCNGCFQSPFNLVPRVFSLSNMAAPGEKTLAHSRNHVTDLSKDSGNLFKMAANIKSEWIWVGGLETGEKQTKWRQRQTQKKLKMWKNALSSHRNTVEWYSDLMFCSMTFTCLSARRSVFFFLKGGAFSNRGRNFFHLWNFENRPLKSGIFLSWRSKTSSVPKFN